MITEACCYKMYYLYFSTACYLRQNLGKLNFIDDIILREFGCGPPASQMEESWLNPSRYRANGCQAKILGPGAFTCSSSRSKPGLVKNYFNGRKTRFLPPHQRVGLGTLLNGNHSLVAYNACRHETELSEELQNRCQRCFLSHRTHGLHYTSYTVPRT